MDEFTEQTIATHLDGTENNVLIVRFSANPSLTLTRSFAIIFIHKMEDRDEIIVQIDGGLKERVHIHYNFKRPPQKEYHNRTSTLETVEYYVDLICANWQWYLAQYKENYI